MQSPKIREIEKRISEFEHKIKSTQTFSYVRPLLYPKQLIAIFDERRYSIIMASTKSGKTHGCIVWLADCAINAKFQGNYWWIAPSHDQSEIAYRRTKRLLDDLKILYTQNETKKRIELRHNGARLEFKSGEIPDKLYGEDVHAAVIDEASRIREESFHAIRSTLTATKGHLRIIGNVKVKNNWSYKLWQVAKMGNDPSMGYHKLDAYDAIEGGIFDIEELEDARMKLPPHVFAALYLAEPADDGMNPFGLDAIRRCIAPLSTAKPVCYGIDLAKSRDWTVLIGLDKDGQACVFERWQSPWELTIKKINAIVKSTPALVDSTGVGDPVLESLQKYGRNYEGYKFTMPSKQQLMEGLAVAIHNQTIRYPDGIIVSELELFEYEYTRTGVKYTSPVDMSEIHDDCVCGLALANQQFTHMKKEVRMGYMDYLSR